VNVHEHELDTINLHFSQPENGILINKLLAETIANTKTRRCHGKIYILKKIQKFFFERTASGHSHKRTAGKTWAVCPTRPGIFAAPLTGLLCKNLAPEINFL